MDSFITFYYHFFHKHYYITYSYFRKEVDYDGQREDRKYWLKIEQVLPRMFYQISSSS